MMFIFDLFIYFLALVSGIMLMLDSRRTSYHTLGAGLVLLGAKFFSNLLIDVSEMNQIGQNIYQVFGAVFDFCSLVIWINAVRLARMQIMRIHTGVDDDPPSNRYK